MSDHLVKATAEGVRVYAAVTTDLVNEAICRHKCYPTAAAALGRTLTGALLLSANLKNKECITMKFHGDGPLGTVVADANPEGFVRGYVDHPQIELPLNDGKLAVGKGIGKGLLSVTRFTGLKEPVTGSSEIFSGEIAEDITRYLYVSEQTPSSVGLGVLVGKDLRAVAAGGFIIQPLPDASESVLAKLENNLAGVRSVSSMVKDGYDAEGIIAELLHGFAVKYLSSTALAFKCQCSRARIEDMLVTLRPDDMNALLSDGKAEVCCHFCGEKYEFDKEDLLVISHVAEKLRERKTI
jgi:molecular chaperone Hsp33